MQNTKRMIFLLFLSLLMGFNLTAQQAELVLSQPDKECILNYTRLISDGKDVKHFNFTTGTEGLTNSIILSYFSKAGEMLYNRRLDDENLLLKDKLDLLIRDVKKQILLDEMRNSFIHIMVVSYTGQFVNYGVKGFFNCGLYEPRVSGIIARLADKSAELNPLECLYYDFDLNSSLQYLAQRLGNYANVLVNNCNLCLEIYHVIHFGEQFPDKKLATFYRGHKVFTTDELNKDTVLHRLTWIGNWYKNNVLQGEVTYKYDPYLEKYKNEERTMVRSAMAVWVLNKLAYFLKDRELQRLGQECIDYYLESYYNISQSLKQNKCIPSQIPNAVGQTAERRYTTASFLCMAIAAREQGLEQYQKEVELLMEWVMQYQHSDGTFWVAYPQSQFFMPGQLLLAVASLYEKTKKPAYKEFFDRSFAVYSQQIRSMTQLADKWYAPIAPAWYTQPFAKMYEITLDNKYRDMVYLINDIVEKWYYMNAQYVKSFDRDGMLYASPGAYNGNVSITAAALESIVDAYHTAQLDGDQERQQDYQKVIKHVVAYLMRLQYLPENTYYIKNRERILGAFKYDLSSNVVWMDNVWHLTSAFLKIFKYGIIK